MKILLQASNLLRNLTIGESATIAIGVTVALMVAVPSIGTIGSAFMLVFGLAQLV